MMEKRRQGTAEFPMHPGIDEEREKSAERGMMTAEQFYNLTPKFWDEHRRGGNYKSDWELRFEFADAHAAAQLAEKERDHVTHVTRLLGEIESLQISFGRAAARAEAAEQRLQEAQAEVEALQGECVEYENCAKEKLVTFLDLQERLRQREAELEQRWIAVGERMPSTTDWVLVYLLDADSELDPSVNIGWYEKGTKCWQGELLSFHERVTHWQPLPSPPKEAKS